MSQPTAVVKGASCEYRSVHDFEKACQDYVVNFLPDFSSWRSGGTYLFPPCFPCRYQSPIGEASGAVPGLTKSEEADIKGDDAELQIFHKLDKFGRENGQPMFVLTKLEFKDFISTVLYQKLPKALVEELLSDLRPEDCTREVDFLIIHRYVGIILIEVKATEKFKPQRYSDAKKQLEVGERFIRAFLSMIQCDIPVFKVVAMPNIPATDRCQESGYIDLRSEDLKTDSNFSHWWYKHFKMKFYPKNEQNLLKLTAILVGQRTSVCATALILDDVFKIIDKQSFLQKNFKKQTRMEIRKTATEPRMKIKKTATEPRLAILAKQFLFLNPEQLLIWNGDNQQMFCGAPGSGKTILLQHKALECVNKQESVVVFVPRPLDLLYRKFFEVNNVLNDDFTVDIVCHADIDEFVKKYPKDAKKCHIFIDEFQVLLSTNQGIVDALKTFMSRNYDQQYYQWIVYDIIQIPMASSSVNVPRNVTALCDEHGFTHARSLTTVMRNTSEVYKFLQTYLQDYSNYPGNKGSGKHAFDKYWKHSIHIGHRISGPVVIVKSLEGEFPFNVIQDEIHEWAKEDGGYCYSKVAVLMAFKSTLISQVAERLQQHRVPVCRIGSLENAVAVDSTENARSYEWPVVIAVIGNVKSMQNYISYSRAITRLVVILWRPV